jgi:hypothetical protein
MVRSRRNFMSYIKTKQNSMRFIHRVRLFSELYIIFLNHMRGYKERDDLDV